MALAPLPQVGPVPFPMPDAPVSLKNFWPRIRPVTLVPLLDAEGDSLTTAKVDEEQPYIDELGRGRDSVFDEPLMYFVEGELKRSVVAPTKDDVRNTLKYQMVEDQQSYYSLMQRSAQAKGRYKMFKAGGAAESTTENTSNSYALHICALVKRFDRSHQYKNGTVKIRDEAQKFIRENRKDKHLLSRTLGDCFVSGVVPGAELFIDIRFDHKSAESRKTCKAQISASFSGLASGTATYSQVISTSQSHKSVIVEITGVNGNHVPKAYTADEAHNIITAFLKDEDGFSRAAYMNYRPIGDILLDGKVLDWCDYTELRRRDRFISEVEGCQVYLSQAHSDATYVKNNPDEFALSDQKRAARDLIKIEEARTSIRDLGADLYDTFKNTGDSSGFKLKSLKGMVPKLKTYPQMPEVAAPTPIPNVVFVATERVFPRILKRLFG